MGRPPDADARRRLCLDELPRERERVLLAVDLDEEPGPVGTGGREVAHRAAVEQVGDLAPDALAGGAVRGGNGEERRVRARRVEAEGRHAPRRLAVVEAVAFEILEQVAREPQLRRADGAAPRQLEAERGLAVMEHEPVVLPERRPVAGGLQQAAAAERELERPVERRVAAGVALGDDAAPFVDEGQRAAEVPADDREQRRDAATFEHGLGQPLVHLERAGQPLELLAREPRRRALRDRDERNLVRNADDRKAQLVRPLRRAPTEPRRSRSRARSRARRGRASPGGAGTSAGRSRARRRRGPS